MKTTVNLFLSAAAMILLMLIIPANAAMAQTITGSKKVTTETRQLPYFDAVNVGGSIKLFITQGDDFHVEVRADDNLIDHILTTVTNGTLEIRTIPRLSLRGYSEMTVMVTAPNFTSIQSGGSSDVTGRGSIRGRSLVLNASGSSDIRMEVDVAYLEVSCSGSSDAILKGQAQHVKARFSGSSDLKARDLNCKFLDLRLSGSSDAYISVEKEVVGSLMGSSDLRIYGQPSVKVRTSGSSSVKAGL